MALEETTIFKKPIPNSLPAKLQQGLRSLLMATSSIYDEPIGDKELAIPLYSICPYKAGSTMLFNYMMDMCKALNVKYVNYPGWLWTRGFDLEQVCYSPSNANEVYNLNLVYLGNREAISTLGLEYLQSVRVLTMIRDPRDCLVSMYFSFLGSHPEPESFTLDESKAWAEHKQRLRQATTIDKYVIDEALGYKQNLSKILAFSRQAGNAEIIRYEDFIFRKADLCIKIIDHLVNCLAERPVISEINITEAAKLHDHIPEHERSNQHIRRALPGDHIEKLQPETIESLNFIFTDFLHEFGYSN